MHSRSANVQFAWTAVHEPAVLSVANVDDAQAGDELVVVTAVPVLVGVLPLPQPATIAPMVLDAHGHGVLDTAESG